MPARTEVFDVGRLHLRPGEGRRLDLLVDVEDFSFGGQRYRVVPAQVPVVLDVARMTGGGHALRLRFTAALHGPCMRCLDDAVPSVGVDAREVDQSGGGDELASPYVDQDAVDLGAWARDALALALPQQIVCHEGCAGLCPECGENLNLAGPGHAHEREPDPRWAKLAELRLGAEGG
jgi:uncharacterized protein